MNGLVVSLIIFYAYVHEKVHCTEDVQQGTSVFSTEFTELGPMDNLTNGSSQWIPPPKSFISSALCAFSMIAVSEIGDKTFFIAVVLALTHSQLSVYLGAMFALVLMTLLSAGLGMFSNIIPFIYVQCVSAILFLIFGIKMLWEGYTMSNTSAQEEFEDVQKTVDSKLSNEEKSATLESAKPKNKTVRWVFIEAFGMTFLAEWGDRSQIATVILAAKGSVVGVILGAIVGHAICTLLAVVGGKMIANRISLKIVTICGGILFLIFAVWSTVEIVEESAVS